MAFLTAEPAMMMYVFCMTIQVYLGQDFILYRTCMQTVDKIDFCEDPTNTNYSNDTSLVMEAQVAAVPVIMFSNVLMSLASIISSQVFGYWLDRSSRKVLMLLPMVGMVLGTLANILVVVQNDASVWWMLLGNSIIGFSGGYVAFKSCVTSYIIGATKLSNRILRLSILEAAIFLGTALGMITAWLLTTYVTKSHEFLYMGNECMAVVGFLYILILVPYDPALDGILAFIQGPLYDTVDHTSADADNKQHACAGLRNFWAGVTNGIVTSVSTTFRKRGSGVRKMIVAICVASVFTSFTSAGDKDLVQLYMRVTFGWDFSTYAMYSAVKAGVNGASILLLLPFLSRCLGFQDASLGVLGGLSRSGYFLFLGFNTLVANIYIGPIIGMMETYLFVVQRSIASHLVEENEQGRMFTVLSSLEQMSEMVGSFTMDNLYQVLLVNNLDALTLQINGLILIIPTIIFCILYIALPKMKVNEETQLLLQNEAIMDENTH